MKINRLIRVAAKAYDSDGILLETWNFKKQRPVSRDVAAIAGDGLSYFVVCELWETFDAKASEDAQLEEAVRVISRAMRQLENVASAIEKLAFERELQ